MGLDSGQQIRKDKGLAKEGLYAIQALVQPIALRFKYHFEGTRQTNRLDKVSKGLLRFSPHILTRSSQPEWYFTHIANEAHEHRPFMESIVQSLVASSEYLFINAWVSHPAKITSHSKD